MKECSSITPPQLIGTLIITALLIFILGTWHTNLERNAYAQGFQDSKELLAREIYNIYNTIIEEEKKRSIDVKALKEEMTACRDELREARLEAVKLKEARRLERVVGIQLDAFQMGMEDWMGMFCTWFILF
jgi:hypothetical protein